MCQSNAENTDVSPLTPGTWIRWVIDLVVKLALFTAMILISNKAPAEHFVILGLVVAYVLTVALVYPYIRW